MNPVGVGHEKPPNQPQKQSLGLNPLFFEGLTLGSHGVFPETFFFEKNHAQVKHWENGNIETFTTLVAFVLGIMVL